MPILRHLLRLFYHYLKEKQGNQKKKPPQLRDGFMGASPLRGARALSLSCSFGVPQFANAQPLHSLAFARSLQWPASPLLHTLALRMSRQHRLLER